MLATFTIQVLNLADELEAVTPCGDMNSLCTKMTYLDPTRHYLKVSDWQGTEAAATGSDFEFLLIIRYEGTCETIPSATCHHLLRRFISKHPAKWIELRKWKKLYI